MRIPGLEWVTRFEVIDSDPTRRAMVRYAVQVDADLQDEGRTLKVFLFGEDENAALIAEANRPPETEYVPTREELARYRHIVMQEWNGLEIPDVSEYSPWLQHVLSQPDIGMISLIDTFDHAIRKMNGDTE